MGGRYLRREKARKCPVHSAILRTCAERLSENGYFEKDDVVEELSFEAVSDSIRWDYIVDFLRVEEGVELIPLASRFFKRHARSERTAAPQKFIASGHGKKTAGYANVELDGGRLAIRILKTKRAKANGVTKAFEKYVSELDKRNLLEDGGKPPALSSATGE